MSIQIEDATKFYGAQAVVNRVSLEIERGEFMVLIGPSGSGKSTLLRMIAGLTPMDAGRISLHGRDVTDQPPQRRGVGFVFQNYALFKHMSAAENISYGLRVRKVSKIEQRERVAELLELVGLAGFGSRLPAQLSGGQQQRVALARALAFNPDVLLLDEPFGALDAKIRTELRRSIKRIQREIGISTIFVTHDQEEAFALADRVGVMHDGNLVELGPSEDLYHAPQHDFTAAFLGNANILVGRKDDKGIHLGEGLFRHSAGDRGADDSEALAKLLVRPEDIVVSKLPLADDCHLVGEAVVEECQFGGAVERLRVSLKSTQSLQVIHPEQPPGGKAGHIDIHRTRPDALKSRLSVGDSVYVFFRRIHCLELLNPLPLMGDEQVTTFLLHCSQSGQAHPEQSSLQYSIPVTGDDPQGGDTMNIDQEKVLVWFGEPRQIERVVLKFSGRPADDRELVRFAREIFSSGRSPAIDILFTIPPGDFLSSEQQQFIAATRKELQSLGGPVRSMIRSGDPIFELRRAIYQADADLLIADLPELAYRAHATGQLSRWVLERLGPVASVLFLPAEFNLPTEEAA
ncbi:MAG: ABC transporter ATP-binding protein [Wenzhouxiangella sp.]|nr:MAG: ABC transporter ATP-binding protein [Wenzhouxiangella sp.]